MSRYIDAENISKQIADFKRVINSPNSDYLTGYLCALSVTEGMIAGTPTADVVEVVRCKDCKYWESGYGYCQKAGLDCYGNSDFYKNSFCSRGKRREECL